NKLWKKKIISVSKLKDESSWTNIDFVRSLGAVGGSYRVSKTLTERTALDFAGKHGLHLVTVLPSWIHGPFISPGWPWFSLCMYDPDFCNKRLCQLLVRTSLL
ncbi:hypothetical protein Pfo_023831, partial [Paulownia fortunei]